MAAAASIKGFSKINLPDDLLQRLVDSIVNAVPTDAIYVFGSYARGEERPGSDVDIYVITSDDGKRPLEYGADVRGSLMWTPLSRDVLAAPRPLFEARSKEFWKVEARVAEEGVRIYG
ncbi:nucleotidyltransferase domain-containing protein [Arabiibacter massiliensis]|uniref:nucleotidyltransferase domain-containing protein n=1 Tax=Arabiibacter massiliensis TaxID=1870985 RepID=UPI0009BC1420|nr:nucleotidyltransferase domain-containing protein [Arabiibacter massiliensis]